jgi:hypothetical protein
MSQLTNVEKLRRLPSARLGAVWGHHLAYHSVHFLLDPRERSMGYFCAFSASGRSGNRVDADSKAPFLERQASRWPRVAYHTGLEYSSYFSEWHRRAALKRWTGWPTVPIGVCKDVLVGGASDLEALLANGGVRASHAYTRRQVTDPRRNRRAAIASRAVRREPRRG